MSDYRYRATPERDNYKEGLYDGRRAQRVADVAALRARGEASGVYAVAQWWNDVADTLEAMPL